MLTDFKKEFLKKGEIYLRIKVKPGSSDNRFLDVMADKTIKIAVKAQAKKGKANQELIDFLAKEFSTAKENVRIINGAGERLKLIKIKS